MEYHKKQFFLAALKGFGLKRSDMKYMRWELEDGFVIEDEDILSCDEISNKTLTLKLSNTEMSHNSDDLNVVTPVKERKTDTPSDSGQWNLFSMRQYIYWCENCLKLQAIGCKFTYNYKLGLAIKKSRWSRFSFFQHRHPKIGKGKQR